MGKSNGVLTLNELFAALQEAAIRENDGFVNGGPDRIKLQHKWADELNAIQEEIHLRDPNAIQQHYAALLHSEHPAIRLAAALGIRKVAPNLAAPILKELSDGSYGVSISMNASTTLQGMKKRGEIDTST